MRNITVVFLRLGPMDTHDMLLQSFIFAMNIVAHVNLSQVPYSTLNEELCILQLHKT